MPSIKTALRVKVRVRVRVKVRVWVRVRIRLKVRVSVKKCLTFRKYIENLFDFFDSWILLKKVKYIFDMKKGQNRCILTLRFF